jgi:hypothetical protein
MNRSRREELAVLHWSLSVPVVWPDSPIMSAPKRAETEAAAEPRISYAIARLHQLVFSSITELAARHVSPRSSSRRSAR